MKYSLWLRREIRSTFETCIKRDLGFKKVCAGISAKATFTQEVDNRPKADDKIIEFKVLRRSSREWASAPRIVPSLIVEPFAIQRNTRTPPCSWTGGARWSKNTAPQSRPQRRRRSITGPPVVTHSFLEQRTSIGRSATVPSSPT